MFKRKSKSYDGFWSYDGFPKGISRVIMDLGVMMDLQNKLAEL
jgi:hypothetical protein